MREVIVGYGEFKHYKLHEISEVFLRELAGRYPLSTNDHTDSQWKQLFVTIAIHEEIKRRESGGTQQRRRPTKRQLALDIVTKGFHVLCNTHHPDRNGDHESQKLLNLAKDYLNRACQDIEEDYADDVIIIDEPYVASEITDDDIPF